MMQRAYSCVILHVKHKTLPFVAVLTWFLILTKIQNGDQDGDRCWWRHRPPAAPLPLECTSYCWEDRRRSTKGKIASKYCNILGTWGAWAWGRGCKSGRLCFFFNAVNSNFRAFFWLAPVTRNILNDYSLFCDQSQDGVSFRGTYLSNKWSSHTNKYLESDELWLVAVYW